MVGAKKGRLHAVPFSAVALLVESELERYGRTVVQVNDVSVGVAGSQVTGGENKLPTRGACTAQQRAAHEGEWATLRSRRAGRNAVDRCQCETGDHGAGDRYSPRIANPELHRDS